MTETDHSMTETVATIRTRVRESIQVTECLMADEGVSFISECADMLAAALRAGGTILFCGNGGSAMDATHLAGELVGRFRIERGPLAALSLTDNVASLSAIANDYGYQDTFARQVRGLGRAGDVLVGLSTSGGALNVLRAIEAARERDMRVVGMTGAAGEQLVRAVDICLRVPSTDTARIQEVHMVAGHTVCELVELALAATP